MSYLEATIQPEGQSVRNYEHEEIAAGSETSSQRSASVTGTPSVDDDLPEGPELYLKGRLDHNKAYINSKLGSMRKKDRVPLHRDRMYTLIVSHTASQIQYRESLHLQDN